jgi:hypothetical protein
MVSNWRDPSGRVVKKGRLVKRLRRGGTVLESSNPMYPPMAIRPENNPVI